jgi:hypothetical protein
MFEGLRVYNARLKAAVEEPFHLRAPFWWVHLPDGREVKIASFSTTTAHGLTSFWSTSERRNDFLLLPEAEVLSVRTEEMSRPRAITCQLSSWNRRNTMRTTSTEPVDPSGRLVRCVSDDWKAHSEFCRFTLKAS